MAFVIDEFWSPEERGSENPEARSGRLCQVGGGRIVNRVRSSVTGSISKEMREALGQIEGESVIQELPVGELGIENAVEWATGNAEKPPRRSRRAFPRADLRGWVNRPELTGGGE